MTRDLPSVSEADRVRYEPGEWTDMRLYSVGSQNQQPTILLLTDDGRRARVQLTAPEAFRVMRSLVGWLGHLYEEPEAT